MTTKFFDNKICNFKILLSGRFPRKTAFWTIFLSVPKAPPLENRKFYVYCRLAVSEFLREFVAATDFFCNSHALLGESRGPENIFCSFYEINSSQYFFLYCKNFGVDGIPKNVLNKRCLEQRCKTHWRKMQWRWYPQNSQISRLVLQSRGALVCTVQEPLQPWIMEKIRRTLSGVARQTKPKKGQFMNFSRGHSGTKIRYVNRACFPKENTRIHKNGRNSWTFRFGPFFGLVCRGDSWH